MKRKKSSGGGANWMDTYGDMVTLLLCFFVLLYSMSTIDESKWKAIVQSFNPSAIVSDAFSGTDGPIADPTDGLGSLADPDKVSDNKVELSAEQLAALMQQQQEVEDALQELYETLQSYVNENGMEDSVEIVKGDGYVFISFNDAVFFAGDSAVLLPKGKEVLDVVSTALETAADYIDEIRVMGHTAQALENRPNTVVTDRTLASNRATNAVIYIQEHTDPEKLSPARLVSLGFGQWRPVAPNDNEQDRAHNRRVEILITGLDLMNQLGDSIQQYTSLRSGTN